jgi:hypothetical protein
MPFLVTKQEHYLSSSDLASKSWLREYPDSWLGDEAVELDEGLAQRDVGLDMYALDGIDENEHQVGETRGEGDPWWASPLDGPPNARLVHPACATGWNPGGELDSQMSP